MYENEKIIRTWCEIHCENVFPVLATSRNYIPRIRNIQCREATPDLYYYSCRKLHHTTVNYRPPQSRGVERKGKNIKAGTKSWDKILLSLYVVCTLIVMNIFIGLDIRYGWPHLDFNYFFIGLALYFLSTVIATKSLLENKYFESSSRIQTERNQTVISTGVYAIVRHPGYSSIILWAFSIPFLTGAVLALIPSIAIIIIISIRTCLEDRMLRRELKGYRTYSRKVRYRLVPYIW